MGTAGYPGDIGNPRIYVVRLVVMGFPNPTSGSDEGSAAGRDYRAQSGQEKLGQDWINYLFSGIFTGPVSHCLISFHSW